VGSAEKARVRTISRGDAENAEGVTHAEVNGLIVVELKSVETLAPVHFKQVLTYLRLLNLEVGLLINFGSATAKEGIHRIVNNYRRATPDGRLPIVDR
jgi:GxxExxY protein